MCVSASAWLTGLRASGSRVFAYGKLSGGFGAARKNDILVFIYQK